MSEFKFDVEALRAQFPACQLKVAGEPIAYLDGPGGTQVPQRVIDAITNHLINNNANEGGCFKASYAVDDVEQNAFQAAADFLGCSAQEVGFNCGSTQLNYNFSVNYVKMMQPGDEVIITEIDHRCNSQPYRRLAGLGMVVKTVRLDPETQQLDFEDFKAKLSPKTKVVAVNWAANAIGTITDVKKYIDAAHEVGAVTVIDAVHYAAHRPVDVKAIGTDVLLCSPYKWFGPHMGLIYMNSELLESLDFNNAGAEDVSHGSRKFHMATPQYELLCGMTEAVNFIADLGAGYTEYFANELTGLEGRRKNIVAGMMAIDEYEAPLATKLRTGLREISSVTVYGPAEGEPRTPTVAFTMEGHTPEEIGKALGDRGINAWHGDFYAIETIEALGLTQSGGVVRFGLAPYCTEYDIDRALATVRSLAV